MKLFSKKEIKKEKVSDIDKQIKELQEKKLKEEENEKLKNQMNESELIEDFSENDNSLVENNDFLNFISSFAEQYGIEQTIRLIDSAKNNLMFELFMERISQEEENEAINKEDAGIQLQEE